MDSQISENGIIGGDTDSIFLSLNPIIEKIHENGIILPEAYEIVDKLQNKDYKHILFITWEISAGFRDGHLWECRWARHL